MDSTLSALTASTPGTAGLLYAVQGGADRKLSMTAAGATLLEAANAAAQLTALGAATLGANTFTGAQTIGGALALGTTPTAYGTLTNTTAAANGAQQVSPALWFTGQGWKSGDSSSHSSNWRIYNLPVQSTSSNPAGSLSFDHSNDAGGFASTMTLTSGISGVSATNLLLTSPSGTATITGSGSQISIGSSGCSVLVCSGLWNFSSATGGFGSANAAYPISFGSNVSLTAPATGTLQMGANHATTATAQTLKAHDVTTGTGASLTLSGGKGSVAGGAVILATSATNGAPVTALTIGADQSTTLAGPLSAIATTITSSSATALTVGQNGATNPALQVDASTGSSATGIKITSAAAGGGVTITATSSAASESLTLSSKGSANTKIDTSGAGYLTKSGVANISWAGADVRFDTVVSATASTVRYKFTGAADTSLTASTEAPSTYFNIGQTRQHATGALTLQRDFRITGSTHSFVGASTLTDAAAFSVDGPCIAGTNATITNSHGIYVPTRALTGTITNAYGLSVAAPSGATNNYAAQFDGKIIMTNLPTSSAGLPTGALWNNSGVLNVA